MGWLKRPTTNQRNLLSSIKSLGLFLPSLPVTCVVQLQSQPRVVTVSFLTLECPLFQPTSCPMFPSNNKEYNSHILRNRFTCNRSISVPVIHQHTPGTSDNNLSLSLFQDPLPYSMFMFHQVSFQISTKVGLRYLSYYRGATGNFV